MPPVKRLPKLKEETPSFDWRLLLIQNIETEIRRLRRIGHPGQECGHLLQQEFMLTALSRLIVNSVEGKHEPPVDDLPLQKSS